MKSNCYPAIIIILLSVICSCCINAQEKTGKVAKVSGDKILIVYLSRTNNTKAVAEMIKANTGGDILALELQHPYPSDYKEIVEQVAKENESGFLPPLKTKIENIERYEVVFVGFPTWGMQLPPPVKSFLKTTNLQQKIIIPFNTNAGYGVGSSFDTLKSLCEKSSVLKGFSVKGGIEKEGVLFVMRDEKKTKVEEEVKQWLNELKLFK